MNFPALKSLAFLLISTLPALGHEFWISPQSYQIEAGENIVADLRVGQNFSGAAFGFIPPNFVRFELVSGATTVPVKGRIGDRPALNMAAPDEGLWVVVHETTDSLLTWASWDKFVSFVDHKKLDNTLELHAERGLSQDGVKERYRRFAKALVAVGAGEGQDREVGLRTEIVAGANPYIDNITNGLPVLVLYEGAPRPVAQIEVFDRDPSGEVTTFTLMTDAEGRADIPVEPGHEYLLDAVKMLPLYPDDPANEPVWESLWAALTFRVPGQ
ncbi:MAG: DUF4198 domain-containing protein [Paracoccaceae bacterium]